MTQDIHSWVVWHGGGQVLEQAIPHVFRFGRSSITGKCEFPMDPADPTYLSKKDPVSGKDLVTFRSHQIATGSPYDMCKELETLCRKRGAVFKYGTKFTGVENVEDGTATSITTTTGTISAKKYVFCTESAQIASFPCCRCGGSSGNMLIRDEPGDCLGPVTSSCPHYPNQSQGHRATWS